MYNLNLTLDIDQVCDIVRVELADAIDRTERLFESSPRLIGAEDAKTYLAMFEVLQYYDCDFKGQPLQAIKEKYTEGEVRKKGRKRKGNDLHVKSGRTVRAVEYDSESGPFVSGMGRRKRRVADFKLRDGA